MGSTLAVPYARIADWPAQLSGLKTDGFTLAALTPRAPAIELDQCARPARVALLVGSEGPGLSDAVMRMVDLRVRIATTTQVDSLNLATATGIALWHFANP